MALQGILYPRYQMDSLALYRDCYYGINGNHSLSPQEKLELFAKLDQWMEECSGILYSYNSFHNDLIALKTHVLGANNTYQKLKDKLNEMMM